jgi:hypothetical protein
MQPLTLTIQQGHIKPFLRKPGTAYHSLESALLDNGYLVATTGHIALIAKLDIPQEFDGKLLPLEAFPKASGATTEIETFETSDEDRVIVRERGKNSTLIEERFITIYNGDDFPELKDVIPGMTQTCNEVGDVVIDPRLLAHFGPFLGGNAGVNLSLPEEWDNEEFWNRPIFVVPYGDKSKKIDFEWHGIIMPLLYIFSQGRFLQMNLETKIKP